MRSFFFQTVDAERGSDRESFSVPLALIVIPALLVVMLSSLELWVFSPPAGLRVADLNGTLSQVDMVERITLSEAATLTASAGRTIEGGQGATGPAVPTLLGFPALPVLTVVAAALGVLAARARSLGAGVAGSIAMVFALRALSSSLQAMSFGSPDGWVTETTFVGWLSVAAPAVLLVLLATSTVVGAPKVVALAARLKAVAEKQAAARESRAKAQFSK